MDNQENISQRCRLILDSMHESRKPLGDRSSGITLDEELDIIIGGIDDMLDIASLDALSRVWHRTPEPPSQHASECNDLLKYVEPEKVRTTLLLALLRFTFRHRSELPDWDSARDSIASVLRDRVPDEYKALLHGLMD